MVPKTNLIVLTGGGLLAANVFLDPTFAGLKEDMKTGKLSAGDVKSSPVQLVIVGLLTLVILSVIADDSPSGANVILTVLFALWVVWLISYNAGKANNAKA
jgi:hypothetical protein